MAENDAFVIPPVHPGEILLEDFLKPMDVSPNRLAIAIHVPAPRIYEICAGKRRISADTALRLARFFGTSAELWMNLQAHYDLEVEGEKIENDLSTIIPLLPQQEGDTCETDVEYSTDFIDRVIVSCLNLSIATGQSTYEVPVTKGKLIASEPLRVNDYSYTMSA